jgi:hypothetical protein
MKIRTGIAALILVGLLATAGFGAEFTINAGIGLNDKSAQFQSLKFFKESWRRTPKGRSKWSSSTPASSATTAP